MEHLSHSVLKEPPQGGAGSDMVEDREIPSLSINGCQYLIAVKHALHTHNIQSTIDSDKITLKQIFKIANRVFLIVFYLSFKSSLFQNPILKIA